MAPPLQVCWNAATVPGGHAMRGKPIMQHGSARPQRFDRHDSRSTYVLRAACEPLERRALLSLAVAGFEFRVNSFTTSDQTTAAGATDADGDFVITWKSDAQDGSAAGVFAQRFNSVGAAQGGEFRVNSFTTGIQQAARPWRRTTRSSSRSCAATPTATGA
jgi:hypothetical protein